jgi:hypothetical protein
MDRIKEELFLKCKKFVDDKFQTIETIMKSNQAALLSETKSSAGDKHETGRAMLQLEMEKASLQLDALNEMKETLDKINFSSNSDISKLGSLVITSSANYFLAISLGKIKLGNDVYYSVSLSSPIGKNLFGSKEGDNIYFNGKQIKVLNIF